MQEQFVPYEIAIKLKELGFNEPCLWSYKTKTYSVFKEGEIYGNPSTNDFSVGAPLWQQAIDWLRERHGLVLTINPNYQKWCVYKTNEDPQKVLDLLDVVHYNGKFEYTEHLKQAIEKALKLI